MPHGTRRLLAGPMGGGIAHAEDRVHGEMDVEIGPQRALGDALLQQILDDELVAPRQLADAPPRFLGQEPAFVQKRAQARRNLSPKARHDGASGRPAVPSRCHRGR